MCVCVCEWFEGSFLFFYLIETKEGSVWQQTMHHGVVIAVCVPQFDSCDVLADFQRKRFQKQDEHVDVLADDA